jgi:hypothetical protein
VAFKDLIRRILHPPPTPGSAPVPEHTAADPHMRELASAWLEALEAGKLNTPRDVHDAAAWDTYWINRSRVGVLDQAFSDMMSSDDSLIDLLAIREARTILCAGNGLSGEALSLALHGFQVTVLEISSVAAQMLASALRRPDHPVSALPGVTMANGVLEFGGSGPIPADVCPLIHRRADRAPCAGGSLRFAVGDLTDPAVCPGPFDVAIERRTIQLFPESERSLALDRLAARLSTPGLILSHLHDGAGGPGRTRPHHALEWARSRGFVIDSGLDPDARRSAARLARVVHTSG